MVENQNLGITWLGHATFVLTSPSGKRILIDPFLTSNPSCPKGQKETNELDLILITHGHHDHLELDDLGAISRATGAPIVSILELAKWLESQGFANVHGMNKGGTQRVAGVDVTMVSASHSSSVQDPKDNHLVPVGEPIGYVIRFENGQTIYFAGDTDVFGDMTIIRRLYEPEIAFLPIGDHFTMAPRGAALAVELLGVRKVVPMHYGTWPVLTGTPAELGKLLPAGVEMLTLKPGETV